MQSFPCLEQGLGEGCPRRWAPRWMEVPETRKCCTNPAAEPGVCWARGRGRICSWRFKEQTKNAGRWQEYQTCLLREGSFSTTPACRCPLLSVESSSNLALRELGWAAKKNRGNHSFMSHPFLPFMLLGISPCVSPSQIPFNYVASKRKESIPVWLLQRWEMQRSLCSSSPVSFFRVSRTSVQRPEEEK